jgi:hypothetical protein
MTETFIAVTDEPDSDCLTEKASTGVDNQTQPMGGERRTPDGVLEHLLEQGYPIFGTCTTLPFRNTPANPDLVSRTRRNDHR